MTAPKPPLAHFVIVLLMCSLMLAQTKKPEKETVIKNSGTLFTDVGPLTVTSLTVVRTAPKTPKEAAEAIKKAVPWLFTDGKTSISTDAGKIATLYEDGRIDMEKGHTVEELTWLLLWSIHANR